MSIVWGTGSTCQVKRVMCARRSGWPQWGMEKPGALDLRKSGANLVLVLLIRVFCWKSFGISLPFTACKCLASMRRSIASIIGGCLMCLAPSSLMTRSSEKPTCLQWKVQDWIRLRLSMCLPGSLKACLSQWGKRRGRASGQQKWPKSIAAWEIQLTEVEVRGDGD